MNALSPSSAAAACAASSWAPGASCRMRVPSPRARTTARSVMVSRGHHSWRRARSCSVWRRPELAVRAASVAEATIQQKCFGFWPAVAASSAATMAACFFGSSWPSWRWSSRRGSPASSCGGCGAGLEASSSMRVAVCCSHDPPGAWPGRRLHAAQAAGRAPRRLGLRARAHDRRLPAGARTGRGLCRAGSGRHARRRPRLPPRSDAGTHDRCRAGLPRSIQASRRRAALGRGGLHARRDQAPGCRRVVWSGLRRRAGADVSGSDRSRARKGGAVPRAQVARRRIATAASTWSRWSSPRSGRMGSTARAPIRGLRSSCSRSTSRPCRRWRATCRRSIARSSLDPRGAARWTSDAGLKEIATFATGLGPVEDADRCRRDAGRTRARGRAYRDPLHVPLLVGRALPLGSRRDGTFPRGRSASTGCSPTTRICFLAELALRAPQCQVRSPWTAARSLLTYLPPHPR